MQTGGRWKGKNERYISFIKPLYHFIQNIKEYMHPIKDMFLYYLFMYLHIYVCIVFIILSSYDFEPEVIFD